MNLPSLTANWNYPTQVRVGAGRVNELAQACRTLGMKAPLLITDPGLAQLPMLANLVQHCRESQLRVAVFSQIKVNPNGENVIAGVNAYHSGKHDGVIAFGGAQLLMRVKRLP